MEHIIKTTTCGHISNEIWPPVVGNLHRSGGHIWYGPYDMALIVWAINFTAISLYFITFSIFLIFIKIPIVTSREKPISEISDH